jgi:hypothetical protein
MSNIIKAITVNVLYRVFKFSEKYKQEHRRTVICQVHGVDSH